MEHTTHTTGSTMDDMHPSFVRTNDMTKINDQVPDKVKLEGGKRRRRKSMRKARKSMRKGRKTMRKGRKTMRKGRKTMRRIRKH